MGYSKFDDIRSLCDSEVPQTVQKLIGNPQFKSAAETLTKPMPWEALSAKMKSCQSIDDFQRHVILPIMLQIIRNTTKELQALGWDNFDAHGSHVYISNHRDIVLDAAFLNILLISNGYPTGEIAIGDNLLIYPWISDLVRLNKSFIVKRQVAVRQMLETSKHLSEYIYDTITNRSQSVWIAQREGRAKDSDDRTQTSLLKMLALYNNTNPVEALSALHIVPLSISYEFDPCDFLKAKEFQQKRDNPEHKKSQKDDLENMMTGIMGNKGRVYFKFAKPIDEELKKLDTHAKRGDILSSVAGIIDKEIHRNYQFFPFNYIAYDRISHSNRFAEKYTKQDVHFFEEYINKQIDKIDLEQKDVEFLSEKIIEMYANTLKNYLVANDIAD